TAEQRPFQHAVERLRVVVDERSPSREGGVADENVEAPEALQRPGNDALAGGPLEDIALDEHRLTAKGPNLGDDGLGLRGAFAVVDGDIGAGTGQLQGAAAADATCSAADQGFFPEKFHGRVFG